VRWGLPAGALAGGALFFWLGWSARDAPAARTPLELPEPGRLILPDELGSLKFAVMGDVGRGDRLQYETAAELARWQERFEFDLVLLLGDNIYGTGTIEDYRTKFEVPYKALLDRGVEFRAAPGNHDPDNITSYPPFGMNGQRYYAFEREMGPPWERRTARFLALDTVRMDRAQLRWIDEQLGRDADWKIALLHYPLYTSARYWFRASRTRSVLEPRFVQGGVNVAFSGHEHVYERVLPQRGIQYFTSGGGGTFRAGDLEASDIMVRGFDEDTHFMLLEIAGDTLHFQVISRTGRTIDVGTVPRAPKARLSPASGL
jgi:3',5'-cyclic AMP phosphodiesterase CpdA